MLLYTLLLFNRQWNHSGESFVLFHFVLFMLTWTSPHPCCFQSKSWFKHGDSQTPASHNILQLGRYNILRKSAWWRSLHKCSEGRREEFFIWRRRIDTNCSWILCRVLRTPWWLRPQSLSSGKFQISGNSRQANRTFQSSKCLAWSSHRKRNSLQMWGAQGGRSRMEGL